MSDTSWASWTKANGVVVAGEGKYPICMTTAASNDAVAAFGVGDFIGELNDINGMGSSREIREINGYRYDSASKTPGSATPNEVNLVLNLVKGDLTLLRGYYNSNQKLSVGIFDKDYTLLYGFNGQISSWGMETPLGDTASLNLTMTVLNDSVAHTFTPPNP